jgi:hypothetical protein
MWCSLKGRRGPLGTDGAIRPGMSEPDAENAEQTQDPQKCCRIRDHDATKEPSAVLADLTNCNPQRHPFRPHPFRPAKGQMPA